MTLVAVVCLFLVCQTPQAVFLVIDTFWVPPEGSTADNIIRGLGNISNFLLAINAASNFIMYCVMSDQYRRTLALTFFPKLYKRRMEFNATLRSETTFRLSSFRYSSGARNSTMRKDNSKKDRSPSVENRKGVVSGPIKEVPDSNESLLKSTVERKKSPSPY